MKDENVIVFVDGKCQPRLLNNTNLILIKIELAYYY